MVNHVAIIPDGNRRWAKANGALEAEGVLEGAKRVTELARFSRELGIKVLTFWGLSTENWKRPAHEQAVLMKLFEEYLTSHLKEALEVEARIHHLGRKDRFNDTLRKKLEDAEEQTKHFTKYHLCFALDYGGHDEILRAVECILASGKKDITEEDFAEHLDTAQLPYPNPDLIIRTSGEERLSGFMPWQSAYSEFMFRKELFPDFTPDIFKECIQEFENRTRRFGK